MSAAAGREKKGADMRRKLTRTGLLLFGILLAAAVFLCIDLTVKYLKKAGNTEERRRYVYLAPSQDELFWRDIALGLKGADQEGGSDTLLVDYRDESNVGSCLWEAMLTHADGIIMPGRAGYEEQIQEITGSGVPVIFFNSDEEDSSRTCYIGIDNYQAGRHAGEALSEQTQGKGQVLAIVRSYPGSANQSERLRGLQDVLEDFPELEIADVIEDHGSLLELKEKLLLSFQTHPDITAIVSTEGIASDNVGDLLNQEDAAGEHIVVVAFDLTETTAAWLRSGEYDVVIMLNPYEIGYTAVSILNAYYETGALPEAEIFIDTVCVTTDNIEEYEQVYEREELVWNSYR